LIWAIPLPLVVFYHLPEEVPTPQGAKIS
jgi:hypothetical protein